MRLVKWPVGVAMYAFCNAFGQSPCGYAASPFARGDKDIETVMPPL